MSGRSKKDTIRDEREQTLCFRARLLDVAGQAVIALDSQGRIVYWNRSAERIYGWTSHETLGSSAREILVPEDLREQAAEIMADLKNGNDWTGEFVVRRRDGTRISVLTSNTLVYDEQGGWIGSVGVSTDISERKRVEEALRESEERFRKLSEAAFEGIFIHDGDRILEVNEAMLALSGYERQELVGQRGLDFVAPEFREPLRQHIFSGSEEPFEIVGIRKDGVRRDLEVRGKNSLYGGREVRLVVVRDVTEHRQREEELRRSEERFSSLVRNASDGIIILDAEGDVLYESPAIERMLGYKPEERIGRSSSELVHPDDLGRITDMYARLRDEPEAHLTVEVRCRHKDGSWRYLEAIGHSLLDDPSVGGIVVNVRDVTERQQMKEALLRSEEGYRRLFERHPQPMWVCGAESARFLAVNEAAVRYYGYSREEFFSMNAEDIFIGEDASSLRPVLNSLAEGVNYTGERRNRKKDGTVTEVEISSHPTTFDGRPARIVQAADITERKILERQLVHQAFHDSLTGLPNRALFADRLQHAMEAIKRRNVTVAVLFADLDNFKTINDSFGHEMGDDLLVAVTDRLLSSLRPQDTLARFGGDEFAILLEDVKAPLDVSQVANRIAEELRTPFYLGGREVFVSASIGISLDDSGDVSPEEMLRKADTAMYQAKARSDVNYQVFEPDMYASVLRRLELENDLRRAIEDEQFTLYYQPLLDLRIGKIVGVEALLRWLHPERGLIGPSEFISLAEDTGLIVPLGRRVLEEACRQARSWQSERGGAPPLKMSVNLSLKQFYNPRLVEEVAAALRTADLEPANLTLEITESVAMKNTDVAVAVLQNLKSLGVRLAIDDFGTGYSSLWYLIKKFRMDLLKIDRSFIRELTRDPDHEVIVSGIIGLARNLNLEVVAEGIETAEQYARLKDMGCGEGQGYYFSGPVPAQEMSALLATDTSW